MAGGGWVDEGEFVQVLATADRAAQLRRTSYGLVLVNIVGLRHLNSERGRRTGDRVLEVVAERVCEVAPTAVLGRVGPSELALLMDGEEGEATQVARRVRAEAAEPVDVDGPLPIELQVTPRTGPDEVMGSVLWAARRDAQWDRFRPLLQRVERLEASVGLTPTVEVELRDLNRRLTDAEDLARRDGLTGVLNRVGAEEMLEASSVPYVLAFVDLDNLREFNASSENYDAGDAALRCVARALAGLGGMVGRWGGDEFVLAVPGGDVEEVAGRMRAELAAEGPVVAGRAVTFSAGVTEVVDDADREPARHRAQALLRQIKDRDLRPAVLEG